MKIQELVNEMFDVSKLKQARDIQKNIEKINQFVNANKDAAGSIANDASNLNTSFASLLAASQAAMEQEAAELKKKEDDEKKKATDFSRARAGVGTTLPIEKPSDAQQADQTK